jgi:signal transduction histidine kinase
MSRPAPSLSYVLASRLSAVLVFVFVAALFGLVLHAAHIEADHPGDLVHEVLREFFVDMAWTIPIIIAVALAMGLWSLRRALAPVLALSQAAARIEPGSGEPRLSMDGVPRELLPLVSAFNDGVGRLSRAFETQRRFTAAAAHELRTPLAVLAAGLERLPASDDVEGLRRDVGRMSRVVAQLLDLARLEAGAFAPETIDLARCVADLARDRAPHALTRDVFIEYVETAPTPASITAPRSAVEAIIANLLDNAVAHAPRGSIVRLTVGAPAILHVEDGGPGVPLDMRDRIFERFFRGAWTTTTGAGLGLSIVAEAARVIGARVGLDRSSFGGARFEVVFHASPP